MPRARRRARRARRRGARRRARGWPRCGRATSVNGRPWPASASRASSASTRSSESRNSPTGSGVWPSSKYSETRPSRWSPEISSRRSGWCRQTCEGAWPGVSTTCQSPRSVATVTPGTRSRSDVSSPEMPVARRRAAARPSAAAAPPARRAGARPRRGGRSSARASRRWRAGARAPGAARPRAPVRSRIAGAWPQWSTCACVQTTSRTCSSRRPAWSSARSRWAIEPGSCIPVSTSTTPSPEASAQALQCGTPGHGSGSRSRQTPGSTRSPRPTSRLRVGLRIRRDANVPPHGQALPAPRRRDPQGPGVRVPLAGRRRARAARGDDPGRAARYAAAMAGLAALAGGRLAARRRVAVRAARGALGDRRRRADRHAEGAARPLPLREPGRAPLDPRRRCASTSPSTSPTSRRRRWRPTPRASRRCCATTASTCSPASRSSCARRTLAAPLLLALQEELLEREAWPLIRAELPGADEGFWQHARDAHLDGFPRRRAGRGGGARTPRSASRRRPTRARSRTSTPARMARAARARAPVREAALRAPLVPDAVADGRGRAAGGHGHDGVRGLRAPRAVPRPRRRDRRLERAARTSRRG